MDNTEKLHLKKVEKSRRIQQGDGNEEHFPNRIADATSGDGKTDPRSQLHGDEREILPTEAIEFLGLHR